MGQPGQQSQQYPRSPHARPLPPSAEPGLWAGDGPRAALIPARKPLLLGVELPYAEGADEETQLITYTCAGFMGYWHAGTATKARGPRLGEAQTRCLAARLYAKCTQSLLEHARQSAAAGNSPDPQEVPRSQAAHAAALRFLRMSCDGVVVDPAADALFKKVARL